MRTDYEHLIHKLDGFIRKYYKDRLIRGVLYSIGLLVGFFLVAALLEYAGNFGVGTGSPVAGQAHREIRKQVPR